MLGNVISSLIFNFEKKSYSKSLTASSNAIPKEEKEELVEEKNKEEPKTAKKQIEPTKKTNKNHNDNKEEDIIMDERTIAHESNSNSNIVSKMKQEIVTSNSKDKLLKSANSEEKKNLEKLETSVSITLKRKAEDIQDINELVSSAKKQKIDANLFKEVAIVFAQSIKNVEELRNMVLQMGGKSVNFFRLVEFSVNIICFYLFISEFLIHGL